MEGGSPGIIPPGDFLGMGAAVVVDMAEEAQLDVIMARRIEGRLK